MQRQEHWNSVYQTKSDTDVSWFESEPQTSLNLIEEASPTPCRVIDVGGGSSRLVDRLLAEGFTSVTVLDISAWALALAKTRLGSQADQVTWVVADITQVEELPQVDLWHDRAVFHFLTSAEDRRKYVELATRTICVGGHLIIGAFGLDGPQKCSGLEVCRYDSVSLSRELGPRFTLVRELLHSHVTPAGKQQLFCFGLFELLPPTTTGGLSAKHPSTTDSFA